MFQGPADRNAEQPRQPRWLFVLARSRVAVLPSALRPVAILLLTIFAIGWGPADYEIHLYGNYYILRQGHNVHSLAIESPPVNNNDKTRRFGVICEGIETYGQSGGIIFGTTVRREYFILTPPVPLHVCRDREKWLDALEKLDVQEPDIRLAAPSPPDNEGHLISQVVWWFIAVAFSIFVTVVLVMLGLNSCRKREDKSAGQADP